MEKGIPVFCFYSTAKRILLKGKPGIGMGIIESIKKDLEKFDMVLVLVDGSGVSDNLTYDFCRSGILKETSKRFLILSETDIPYMESGKHEYRRLDGREMETLQKLYAMYEFSDRFRVLSDNPQYGGLLNYVKTGIMTLEEAFRGMLGG